MKVFAITLGCKVNQYETQATLALMEKSGYQLTDTETEGDIIVINSCTVTGVSDQKVRQTLHRARRICPGSMIVLTGCMPQAFPEESALLTDADIVVGNSNRSMLPELIQRYLSTHQRMVEIRPHKNGDAFETMQVTDFHERTRAFVKIEDGCNRFCSYCIIPTARGRVRSKPLDELKAEIAALDAAGYREIVLVGINLSAYGQECGLTLCDAVDAACASPGISRVRLGSLEPDRMDDATLQRLAAQPKLCPQFHLSLQSGCDATLRRMNRHYTAAEYAALCARLRKIFPNCSLTTDVMVGFAGETDSEFQESLEFVRQIAFAKVHVFPYSVRPGTAAATRTDQIPSASKESRTHWMLSAAAELRAAFLQTQLGQICDVLFETRCKDGSAMGYTSNYTPVHVPTDRNLQNQLLPVRLVAVDGDCCIGEICTHA